MKTAEGYARDILLAYQGEIRGAVTFDAMARHESDPVARGVWEKVAELEALTRDAVAPLAERLLGPLDPDAHAAVREEALARAAARRGVPCEQIARDYLPDLARFVARFDDLLERTPSADRPVVEQLRAHSQAFGACIRAWLDGNPNAALGHLQDYLDRYRQ